MLELDYLSVRGFKSLASVEQLKLGPINILIGANGSGKSNFVGVFQLLHAIREGQLREYVAKAGGAERVLHFGSKVTNAIQLHVSFRDGVNQYHIDLAPTGDDQLYPVNERVYFWDRAQFPTPYNFSLAPRGMEAGISDPNPRRTARYVRDHLGQWRVYHFHDTSNTSPLKKTADLHDNAFLRADGANLAAFLYLLAQKHESSYGLIRNTVQQVAPFFRDFQLAPGRLNADSIRLEWRHTDSDSYFDASSLSDGTLRFIALATLFLQPPTYRPPVIVVDEPELGLHPFAITVLASLIKQASHQTQVIVATQSSLLLDQFAPEDVLVADRVQGATQITRQDPNRLAAWLEDYSLGQLWEKNELGGRPSRG
jgi:predicted ATPase